MTNDYSSRMVENNSEGKKSCILHVKNPRCLDKVFSVVTNLPLTSKDLAH